MPREWTPDQPLRAEATDAQMRSRGSILFSANGCLGAADVGVALAREYAAACVEAAKLVDGASRVRWQDDPDVQDSFRVALESPVDSTLNDLCRAVAACKSSPLPPMVTSEDVESIRCIAEGAHSMGQGPIAEQYARILRALEWVHQQQEGK